MTERERILTLLAGGRPDRAPWFGDLDYWATALIGRGLEPRDFKESAAYIDWHRALGVGFYLQGYFPFRTVIENCRVSERRERTARRRTIETPHGVLAETWTWRIRAAGIFSCVHLDGTLKGLLRQVASAGFTIIEAMTPAAAGDLEVGKWAEWCGNASTVLWGGLPGVYFTDKISDAEFERHVRSVLDVMTSRPRYVLGVADHVPPEGLERRVRRAAGEMVAASGACRTWPEAACRNK